MKTLCGLMSGLWILFLALGCTEDPARVIDSASLFRPEQAEQIGRFHRYLLADHDIDYRVLTLNNAVDINAYAIEQFEKLQVGALSKTGRGLLLVIDSNGNRVRLEVSRALEGPYPDALIAYIEQRQMTPFFAARRIVDGILAATELIVTRAQHTQANQGWDDEVWAQASAAGAGATADAQILEADAAIVSSLPKSAFEPEKPSSSMAASDSPEAALQAYLQAMSDRNADADLAIYTDATRAMLKQWVVTPAQMDSIVKAYRNCHAEHTRYNEEETLAVIRYPVGERACAPWFFVGNGDHWQLDLTGA